MPKLYVGITGLAIFIICAIGGCRNTQFPEDLARIDSLIVRIDSALYFLHSIDTAGMAEQGLAVQRNMGFISAHLKSSGDTLSKYLGVKIADHKNAGRLPKYVHNHYAETRKGLLFSQSQASALRHDVFHNKLSAGQVKKYYQEELARAHGPIADAEKMARSQQSSRLLFTTTLPVIDSLIHTIKEGSGVQ